MVGVPAHWHRNRDDRFSGRYQHAVPELAGRLGCQRTKDIAVINALRYRNLCRALLCDQAPFRIEHLYCRTIFFGGVADTFESRYAVRIVDALRQVSNRETPAG